jgi:hypothetical protein
MKRDKQKQLIIEMMQEDEKLGLYQKGTGIISRIGKFIDSNRELIVLLITYICAIGLLIILSMNVSL